MIGSPIVRNLTAILEEEGLHHFSFDQRAGTLNLLVGSEIKIWKVARMHNVMPVINDIKALGRERRRERRADIRLAEAGE